MDPVEIKIFLQLVHHKSISKAAQQVHLSQSTVSKRLQMLEQKLGCVLVERGKGIKKFALTSQGEKFIAIAERWMDVFLESKQIRQSTPTYTINIGTVPSANMTFVPKLCKRLWNHEPHICTKIISLHSWEMYEEVGKHNIDVGFSLVEQIDSNVIVEPCFSVPMVGICLKKSKIQEVKNTQDLDPSMCIYIPWGARFQNWYDDLFYMRDKPRLIFDNPYILLSVFESEKQWAIAPQAIANLLLESGQLACFSLNPAPPDRVFLKLTHRRPRPTAIPALTIFNHYLHDEIKNTYGHVYKDIQLKDSNIII